MRQKPIPIHTPIKRIPPLLLTQPPSLSLPPKLPLQRLTQAITTLQIHQPPTPRLTIPHRHPRRQKRRLPPPQKIRIVMDPCTFCTGYVMPKHRSLQQYLFTPVHEGADEGVERGVGEEGAVGGGGVDVV